MVIAPPDRGRRAADDSGGPLLPAEVLERPVGAASVRDPPVQLVEIDEIDQVLLIGQPEEGEE